MDFSAEITFPYPDFCDIELQITYGGNDPLDDFKDECLREG